MSLLCPLPREVGKIPRLSQYARMFNTTIVVLDQMRETGMETSRTLTEMIIKGNSNSSDPSVLDN